MQSRQFDFNFGDEGASGKRFPSPPMARRCGTNSIQTGTAAAFARLEVTSPEPEFQALGDVMTILIQRLGADRAPHPLRNPPGLPDQSLRTE